ncbi:hypothetical protein [Blastococcus sp. SYSU D00820]
MSDTLTISPGLVAALADSLAGLAADLAHDSDVCRTAGVFCRGALDGVAGERTADLGAAWAGLVEATAEGAAAVARTLGAAAASYVAADTALAAVVRVGSPR